jgi:hypothetical protein
MSELFLNWLVFEWVNCFAYRFKTV